MRDWLKRYGWRLLGGVIVAAVTTLSAGLMRARVGIDRSGLSLKRGAQLAAYWLNGTLRAKDKKQRQHWMSDSTIGGHFRRNKQHGQLNHNPPGPRWVFAIGQFVSKKPQTVDKVAHWIAALLLGLTAWMVFALGCELISLYSGVLAALCFLVLPGVLYYGRAPSVEVVLLFAVTATVFCTIGGLQHRAWAIASGPAFGLACLSAVESLFLIVPLAAISFLSTQESTAPGVDRGRLALPSIKLTPLWTFAMGIGMYVGLNPSLWNDTKQRLIDSVVLPFKLAHLPTLLFGTLSVPGTTPPFSTTLRLLLGKVPLMLLFFALVGLGWLIRAHLQRRQGKAVGPPLSAIALVLVPATLFVLHSINGSPYYYQQNYLVLYFPFVALFASYGALQLAAIMRERLDPPTWLRAVLVAGLALLMLVPASIQLARVMPDEPAYFNVLQVRGAQLRQARTDLFPRATVPRRMLDRINRSFQQRSLFSVQPHTGVESLFHRMRREGLLRGDLRLTRDVNRVHYLILVNRPGRPGYGEWLNGMKVFKPLATFRTGAATRYTIYRLPN